MPWSKLYRPLRGPVLSQTACGSLLQSLKQHLILLFSRLEMNQFWICIQGGHDDYSKGDPIFENNGRSQCRQCEWRPRRDLEKMQPTFGVSSVSIWRLTLMVLFDAVKYGFQTWRDMPSIISCLVMTLIVSDLKTISISYSEDFGELDINFFAVTTA